MKKVFNLFVVMLGISVSAQVSRVQTATGNTGANAAATISVTMSTAPVNGNTLIAIIATRGTTSSRVSSITQTGATWTKAVEGTNASGSTTEIWYAPNVSGAGTTVTIAQASLLSTAVIAEYSGLLTVSPLDVSKSNFGSGNTINNGATGTTSQADELLIAGVGITNSSYAVTNFSGTFTNFASDASTNATPTNNSKVYAYDRIVSATGTFSPGGAQPSTNSPWTSALATFKIVTNTAGVASSTPILCVNTPLINITHTTTLATGIVNNGVSGTNNLPAGVSATWSNNTITISGTPTVAGTYNYNIPLSGGVGTVYATGTIKVDYSNTVYLASAAATRNQTVCINTAIGATQYQFNGLSAMTGVSIAPLPSGLSISYNNTNKVVNITGTPLESGTFNYTVTSTGGVCDAISTTGTIIVTPNHIAAAGSSAPILYVNTALTPITHTTANANGINTAAITGLPSGTNASFASNTVTISGTPTATGTFTYNIPLTGSCGTGAATGTIKVCPALVGGTLAGSGTVCRTSNSTTLTLSGHTGTISRWESSLDNFVTPGTAITNTTTSLTASSLTATTYYRAVITALSGACIEYSTTATITVSLISLGGTIDGSASVCSGTNSTTLTLSGHRGTITRWESSPVSNFASGITTINNTTTTLIATNLTATTYYRAVITNSPCATAVTAVAATVGVFTAIPAAPDAITGEALLCNNLTNKTYSIAAVTNATTYNWTVPTGWSITAGAGTRTITVTVGAADQNGNISVTAQNACGTSTARTLAVTVAANSVGGTITGSAIICTGTNSTDLILSSYTGAITRWESSTSSTFASGVNSITNTTATLTASGLTTTTYYRAVLTSGACASANSTAATLTVSPASVGGTIAGSATVFIDTNSTTLTISGYTGSITRWESSLDNFATAGTSIANTTTYLTANNLTASTYYRAVITSSPCSAANSTIATVMVTPAASAQTFCGNKTVSDLVAIGTNLKWYNVATNGTALTTTTAIATGTYYVSQTVNGGESSRTSVAVTVNNSVAGTISANQTITWNAEPDAISLTNSSGAVQWQSSNDGVSFSNINGATETTLLGVTIGALTTNKYFRAIVNNGGCGNVTSAIHSVTIITTTTISPAQCELTLNALDTQIAAIAYLGAQMYRFQVTKGASVSTFETTKYNFDLTKILGTNYSTTYGIRVAVKINGVWGDYGTSCTINTPALTTATVLIPKLLPTFCDSNLAALDTKIGATPVYISDGYRFEIKTAGVTTIYNSTTYNFRLADAGIAAYGTTYAIRVAAQVNGVYGNYGASCNVTTPTMTNSAIPTTKVLPAFCGTALAALDTKIGATPVALATGYRFEIIDGGVTTVYNATAYNFRLTDAAVATYGTTYAIRVAAQVNGVYGNYGASCNVTTPTFTSSAILTTKVLPAFCGTTLAALDTKIGAIPVALATGYRFEIIAGGITTVYNSAAYNFKLTDAGIAAYGTTYSIRVAALVSGTYGNYGSSCSVATPALIINTVPTTTINPIYCGATLAALDTKIGAVIVAGATKGRFEVTIAGGSPVVYEVAAYNFKLSQTGVAVLYNTNYAIRVAAYINGVWGNYGASCTVTTPAAPAPARLKAKSFEVAAYPNPFDTAFNLNLETPSKEEVTIAVYDMMGKLMETHQVNPMEVANLAIGSNFAAGIYNVIVSQANEMQAIRLIRK